MARRKRRTTQKARSHSPAAWPRLTFGDVGRVKDGGMDPAYAGYGMGGWSGASIALDPWEQTPMALIAWDAPTPRERIDPEGRRRAARQGLAAAQMWLPLSACARVDRATRAPRSEGQPREQGVEPSAASWTPPSCGHACPDVLRLRAEVRAEGTCVRMTDGRHGGRAEIPFPASLLAAELRLALEATGTLAGLAEEEIEAARQRAERRLRKPHRAGRWWQRVGWRSCVRPR
jgi:hypothetical protein